MFRLVIGKQEFKYLVGDDIVAIITPSRQKHIVQLSAVEGDTSNRVHNGTSESRVSSEEVANYIVSQRLK